MAEMVTSAPMEKDPRPLVSLAMLGGICAFLVAILSQAVLSDPDSFWHIAVGRWMVDHRQLPVRDVFSHSVPGISWTAHEWLSELVLWGTHRLGGWAGLHVLAAVCFAVTAGYMLRFLVQRLEPVYALPVWAVNVAMLNTHLLARPHVLVWPVTAVWVGQLVAAGERRSGPPWWALLLVPLWANLHGSFVIAIGIASVLGADAVWSESHASDRMTAARPWLAFLGATAVLVCINPHGPATFLHAVAMMRMQVMLSIIQEWRSADFHVFQFLLVWMAGTLALALAGRLRLSPFRILLLGGFLYLALKHRRYHSLLGLVSPFVLALPLATGLTRNSDASRNDVTWLDHLLQRMTRPARRSSSVIALALLTVAVTAGWRAIPNAPQASIRPIAGLRAVRSAGVSGRVFNSYNFGGFLIFEGVPVFVDGRADMYGDPFIATIDSVGRLARPHIVEALFSRYQIGWTFLKPNTPLVELLDHTSAWRRLYADSAVVVHVRAGALSELAGRRP